MKRTNLEDIEPDPALPLDLGILLATWKDGIREWRDNLGAPPPEAVTWQIYPEGPSIGGILLHLASCDQFWLQEFAEKATLDRTDPAIAYDLSMDQYIPVGRRPRRNRSNGISTSSTAPAPACLRPSPNIRTPFRSIRMASTPRPIAGSSLIWSNTTPTTAVRLCCCTRRGRNSQPPPTERCIKNLCERASF